MNPPIKQLIRSGLLTVNKSFKGMAAFTVCWALVFLLSAAALMLTFPPLQAFTKTYQEAQEKQ